MIYQLVIVLLINLSNCYLIYTNMKHLLYLSFILSIYKVFDLSTDGSIILFLNFGKNRQGNSFSNIHIPYFKNSSHIDIVRSSFNNLCKNNSSKFELN